MKTYILESIKIRIPENLLENFVLNTIGLFYTQNLLTSKLQLIIFKTCEKFGLTTVFWPLGFGISSPTDFNPKIFVIS